ncbi:MAG: hypothetical protein ACXADB_15025, partial [Candidatus Hermodarchaeia archaeon]
MDFTTDYTLAQKLDEGDALAPFREKYVINEPDLIYLDGNSLGRLPKETVNTMHRAIEHDWGVTPFAKGRDKAQIRSEIDAFNHGNYQETQLLGAGY